MGKFPVLALMSALACFGSPAAASAENITDMTVTFKTTDDDREGGVVEVTLWQGDRLIARYDNTERAWGRNMECKESATNPLKERAFDPAKPIEARVKLKEGREVNISWRFKVRITAYDNNGREYSIPEKVMRLDTTGRGANREDEQVIGSWNPPQAR